MRSRGYTEADLHPRWADEPRPERRAPSHPHPGREGAAGAWGALLPLVPLALLGLQRMHRTAAVDGFEEGEPRPSASGADFPELVERYTRAVFRTGNQVEILCNGEETFPRLWADLQAAQRSIDVQIYFAESGRAADRTFEVLRERARGGVRVRLLYDPVGCRGLGGSYVEALRRSGAGVHVLRPLRVADLDRVNHRAHSRIMLIDGRIGYTGDLGISDRWLGDGRTRGSWRSTNARFRGPALREHWAAFATLWAEATGKLLVHEALEAGAAAEPGHHAALLHASPTVGSTPAERVWALSLASAERSCDVTSGYFAPTPAQVRLLCGAARRGVRVRVLTAAAAHTDVPPAYWAGRSAYPALLEAGVEVHEYEPSMLHAKSWVIDGVWCSVGALNLDSRSVGLNDEVALMVHDRAFGARLRELFDADLGRSRQVLPQALERAARMDRVKAAGARRIRALL